MEFAIKDSSETKEYLLKKVSSKKWWMFVIIKPRAAEIMEKIENAFYYGEKNKFFELIVLPPEIIPGCWTPVFIVLARKDEMKYNELNLILKSERLKNDDLKNDDKDIVFFVDNEHEKAMIEDVILSNIFKWLEEETELHTT